MSDDYLDALADLREEREMLYPRARRPADPGVDNEARDFRLDALTVERGRARLVEMRRLIDEQRSRSPWSGKGARVPRGGIDLVSAGFPSGDPASGVSPREARGGVPAVEVRSGSPTSCTDPGRVAALETRAGPPLSAEGVECS